MIKVAVLGYGTIGSGVVEVIDRNNKLLAKRIGEDIEVKYILDLREFPGNPNESKIVHDFSIIKDDPEIDIVVECMGGVEPAFTFASEALRHNKHFTTSNKALIADKGAELIAIAREHNVNCQFEASVGGGIPIIRAIHDCLTADIIEEISGILNGTTNYMLTKMCNEGAEFHDALKDAQSKGYAEANPAADIEGYDPCRKIAILTSLISGRQVDYNDIHTEGISNVTATDIGYAKSMNKRIRLIASSYLIEDNYTALVAPYLVGPENPLYDVEDVFNGILVHGNMLGDAMFYGQGAGKLPTASAVVADVVEIAKNKDHNIFVEWAPEKMALVDYRNLENCYFVRTSATKVEIEAAFGKVNYVNSLVNGEVAFVTDSMNGFVFDEAAAKIPVIQRIRIK